MPALASACAAVHRFVRVAVARPVVLGLDFAACCDLVERVAALPVVAVAERPAVDFVPADCLDLAVRASAVVVAVRPVAGDSVPAVYFDLVVRAFAVLVVVAVQSVVGDFVPAVAILAVGSGLADYFVLLGRAGLVVCFALVPAAWVVEPAVFVFYLYLDDLVAGR